MVLAYARGVMQLSVHVGVWSLAPLLSGTTSSLTTRVTGCLTCGRRFHEGPSGGVHRVRRRHYEVLRVVGIRTTIHPNRVQAAKALVSDSAAPDTYTPTTDAPVCTTVTWAGESTAKRNTMRRIRAASSRRARRAAADRRGGSPGSDTDCSGDDDAPCDSATDGVDAVAAPEAAPAAHGPRSSISTPPHGPRPDVENIPSAPDRLAPCLVPAPRQRPCATWPIG